MNEELDIEDFAPWLIIALTLVGGFLRVLLLDFKGLWLDETFSIWMANHNLADMLQWIIKIDQHPPLYYLLLHNWITLGGDSVYNVRFLSVLFGAATIPVVYLIGKRMSGRSMGIIAAAILAFSPINIFYGQEARMYTLLMFNASVAIYALVRILTDPRSINPIGTQFRDYLRAWRAHRQVTSDDKSELQKTNEIYKPNRWRAWVQRHQWLSIRTIETDLAWVVFILFSALTLYSHNTAILLPIALNVFVLGLLAFKRINKASIHTAFTAPTFANWIKSQIGMVILWLPWAYPFIKQAGSVNNRFWIPTPTWDSVLQVIKTFVNASATFPTNIANKIWIFFAVVFCLGLFFYHKKISQFMFLIVLFCIPFIVELVVSIWKPIFLDRTLLWTTIPLSLIFARGIAKLKFRFLIVMVLGVFSTINLFSVSDYFRFYQKEDWGTAARNVGGMAEKNDLILFNSNFVEIPFNYYFEDYEIHRHLDVEKRGLPLDLIHDGVLEPLMTKEDIPGLISVLDGHDRVWLVYSHDSYTDPDGLIPQTLASQMTLDKEIGFYGGQVMLYVNH